MHSRASRNFHIELTRLRWLYASVRHAFKQNARITLAAVRRGEIDTSQPYVVPADDPRGNVSAPNVYVFLKRADSQLSRYLRETLLVRVISALEVFLIDRIRELFLNRRDLFHTHQRVEFPVSELLAADSVTTLWSKVIGRELRRLQNQGFDEIVRYYRNRLQIDLALSPVPLTFLEQLHMKRHLLVHRLGRADEEYRHRFNANQKRITVPEQDLLDCFQRTAEFVDFVDTEASALEADVDAKRPGAYRARVVLETTEPAVEKMLERDYMFTVEDQVVRLSDLLVMRHVKDHRFELVLLGQKELVRPYLRQLKKAAKRGDLTMIERWWGVPPAALEKSGLDHDTLERIASQMPALPWPRHIHKQVAVEHGISPRVAWAALAEILSNDSLRAHLTPTVAGTTEDTDLDFHEPIA